MSNNNTETENIAINDLLEEDFREDEKPYEWVP